MFCLISMAVSVNKLLHSCELPTWNSVEDNQIKQPLCCMCLCACVRVCLCMQVYICLNASKIEITMMYVYIWVNFPAALPLPGESLCRCLLYKRKGHLIMLFSKDINVGSYLLIICQQSLIKLGESSVVFSMLVFKSESRWKLKWWSMENRKKSILL